jgi:copper oxidase (laccase) domain-containing protein
MAPSVKQQDYVMEYFDHAHDSDWQQFVRQEDDGIHLDLQGFNRNLALQMGVSAQNIHVSPINTARSVEYFSHSQGDTKGRFALLAMMK